MIGSPGLVPEAGQGMNAMTAMTWCGRSMAIRTPIVLPKDRPTTAYSERPISSHASRTGRVIVAMLDPSASAAIDRRGREGP